MTWRRTAHHEKRHGSRRPGDGKGRARMHGLAFLGLFAFHLYVPPPLIAQPADSLAVEDRYKLVSAFLYNFLMFTEWPEDNPEAPLIIAVVGENPFGEAADAISQKTLGGRAIQFMYFASPEDVGTPHILFIPRSQEQRAPGICAGLRGKPVLTVGESDRFTRQGGMIRFYEQPDRSGAQRVLRIEINETTADAAGLRFQAKLMRLAQIVRHPWPD